MVNSENEDRVADRQSDENHDEEKVFAQEWNHDRRRRDQIGEQREDHGQRQFDADAQNDLLARLTRQVEDRERQQCDANARNDQVDDVEERLTFQNERVGDIVVGLQAARVFLLIAYRRSSYDVPFAVGIVITKEDALRTVIVETTCHFDVVVDDVR